MKKGLIFSCFFIVACAAFSQPAYIDAGPDTVTCPPDCIDLTAIYSGGGNTTDYTVAAITYAPDPYAGTTVSLCDDCVSGAYAIGFEFCFYGNTYSTFNIGANGWISFTGGPGTYTPVAIPSVAASTPKNCIMGPWQDLHPGVGGTIKYQTLGVAPYRRLVVTWQTVPFFSCTGILNTQQIIIYETTNIIENHIQTKLTCPGWVGGRATQGIHNLAGTMAVPFPGRNNTVWTATNHAIRYTPLGDGDVEWYIGPLLIGTGADITVCPATPTTFTAKLISCSGVIDTDDIFVDVICCEPPTMSHTDVSCFGGCDGTGTAEGIGVAPFTYLWDPAAGSQTTATAVDLCAGTYTVTVTDALGCVETGEVTIGEPEELTGMVTATTIVTCFGLEDGTGTVEGAGGTGAYTYDIGAGPVAVGYFTDLAPGTYPVTITDENGCTEVVDLIIVSPELLEAVLVEVVDVTCNGGSDGEITIDAIGGVVEFEFSISGDPFVPSGVFGGLAAGTYDLQVMDSNGCLADITVDVNEPPAIMLDVVSTVNLTCFGGSDGEIVVSGSGGIGALEYSDDGVTFGPSGSFTGFDAGTHTITVRDENDCETTLDVVLTEPAPVDANETIVAETCFGDCLGMIDLEGIDGVAPYAYSIDGCTTTDLLGSYSDLCAGDYDVCIVDANGCEYTSTVTVMAGTPYANATITDFGDKCVNDAPVTLSAVSPGGVYSGPGVVGGVFDPGLAGPGTHTITNTIAGVCGDIATLDVTVNPLPTVDFSTLDAQGCEPHMVNFINTSDAGVDCNWDFGDGHVSDFCGSTNHLYQNAGEYDVSLTVTDANGCTNSKTLYDYITVFEVPSAAFRFGPQPTTTINTEINFTDLSTGAELWTWDFDVFGNSNDQNPTFFFPEEQGEYIVTLTVANDDGCTDQTSQTVIIAEQFLIYVPNAITPDGDAFNEVFKPYFNGIDVYKYSMTLYNRWGEVMFETHNVDVGWNGTYGGEIVPAGVYIWHIIADELSSDRKLEFHGHVTVLE